MNVRGKKIELRSIERNDLDLIHEWANSSELWKNLGGWHFPYSKDSTEQWIRKLNENDMNNYTFAIDAEGAGIVGTANLVNIDWKNRNAFHGMMLGEKESRGKGYAKDAVMTIMRFAFDELGLQRLDGDMIAYNKRSIKFYTEGCGWSIEGVKKDWFYRSGEFHDKVVVGITKSEYKEFNESVGYWN